MVGRSALLDIRCCADDWTGPYYTCAFVGNREDWPESVKEAIEVVNDSVVGYGEFPSGMVIQRVEVLAWFIKGSAKFKVGSFFMYS